MKIPLLFIVLFQLLSCQEKQENNLPKKFLSSDLSYYDLMGKVKFSKIIYKDDRFFGNDSELIQNQYNGIIDTVEVEFNKKGVITSAKNVRYSIKITDNLGNTKNSSLLVKSSSKKYGFEEKLFDYKKNIDSEGKLINMDKSFEISYNENKDPLLKKFTGKLEKYNDSEGYFYYEYDYDSQGNWIKRTCYFNENKKEIRDLTIRQIEYYEN